MKTLVTGWFSFEQMGATAGDLLSCDLTCRWLTEAGHEYDVAYAPPFTGGVNWREVDPQLYDTLVFVCGPFGENELIREFLDRFGHCRKLGLNLSMLQSLSEFNPFETLLERDSARSARPDISFAAKGTRVPIIGVVLVHPQEEYGAKSQHTVANQAVERLLASREIAAVPIDTRLDENSTGLRTPAEVESLIASMSAVVTTRLHGMVMSIKNGVAPLVIDPVAGGAKVMRQAQTIGWPVAFSVDELDDAKLSEALSYCLSDEARVKAGLCADAARLTVDGVRKQFVDAARAVRTGGR